MNLSPTLGLEDIQSYQCERGVTVLTPFSDKFALHEPQVDFERLRSLRVGRQIGVHADAVDDGKTDMTVKVGNC